ncbi:MAG: glucose-6-phosphate isomerase, partial [Bacteroidota bacterium]
MFPSVNPVETNSWQRLTTHFLEMQATHLRELFAEDASRFEKFHAQFEDILIDYSKNIISEDTLKLLISLANECELREAIDA